MKTIRILFGTIILWLGLCAYSQEDANPVILKYDLVSLLGDQVTNSAGILLGLEKFIRPRHSVNLDAMYIFPCAGCGKSYTSINTESTKGLSVSAGARYYPFVKNGTATGFFFGPLFSYQFTRSEMWEASDTDGENHYQVYRSLFSAHVMAGYQIRIIGPFFFDPSIGLGTRFVSSRNENKTGTDSGQHEFLYDKDFESGSKWFPSLTFSIKIGLKI